MTLLITEIHNHDDARRAAIIFAADRRISINGRYHGLRKKIFALPRLNAAIGYFGLAEVNGAAMADWLGSHVRQDNSASLADFAKAIATRLNTEVPVSHRRSVPSGFHIAGFGHDRR